jgi:hypothetical protein
MVGFIDGKENTDVSNTDFTQNNQSYKAHNEMLAYYFF